MKLILAIIPSDDAGGIVDSLTHEEIGVTRINTVSGFMKKGNATLLIG
ncbi:MAG: cyclic-di-AMP receptor, partial [Chloroflexota bacterium]